MLRAAEVELLDLPDMVHRCAGRLGVDVRAPQAVGSSGGDAQVDEALLVAVPDYPTGP
jgi:hypothetical protein